MSNEARTKALDRGIGKMMRHELAGSYAAVQRAAVSDTRETSRRWSGYVCPDCRFVFRLPGDHDGRGTVCPSCRRLLKIPAAGDSPPPLLAPVRSVAELSAQTSAASTEDPAPRRRVKKRRRAEDASLAWEAEGAAREAAVDPLNKPFMVLGGLILLSVAGLGIWWSLGKNSQGALKDSVPSFAELTLPTEEERKAEDQVPEVELPAVIKRGEMVLREEFEPIARQFLEASSIEEILPVVLHPEQVRERILRQHPGGQWAAPGMARVDDRVPVSYLGNVAAFTVLTRAMKPVQLAVVDSPEGLKIDWECYAGWSDMSWEDFMKTRPTEPQMFRVWVKAVDYYNFDFRDESKWESFRLESPDHQTALYGYAPRDSVLAAQIQPPKNNKLIAVMLALKFPADARSSDQVIIDRFIAEGWVRERQADE